MKNEGMSYVELVNVVLLLGIFSLLALPNLRELKAGWELKLVVRDFTADFQWLRQEAVLHVGDRYWLEITATGYRLHQNDQIIKTVDLEERVRIFYSNNLQDVFFTCMGRASKSGHYLFKGKYGRSQYVVLLGSTGRIRLADEAP